jgi:hypothetical protein
MTVLPQLTPPHAGTRVRTTRLGPRRRGCARAALVLLGAPPVRRWFATGYRTVRPSPSTTVRRMTVTRRRTDATDLTSRYRRPLWLDAAFTLALVLDAAFTVRLLVRRVRESRRSGDAPR